MSWGTNPTDEQILARVSQWIRALAARDFEGAFALTQHDPYYGWTPALLEQVISGYGSAELNGKGEMHAVSVPENSTGGPPRRTVQRIGLPHHVIAYVEHDLPLNGAWSDLTATFSVVPGKSDAILQLEEIHVL